MGTCALLCSPQAKHRLYLDRLQLIAQRMRRNKIFQQNNQLLSGSGDTPTAQVSAGIYMGWVRLLHAYAKPQMGGLFINHHKRMLLHWRTKPQAHEHATLSPGSTHDPLPTRICIMQLTDLQSMRGMVGVPRIVMGALGKGEGGRGLVLEDSSGAVPLVAEGAETTAGFFTGGWSRMPCRECPALACTYCLVHRALSKHPWQLWHAANGQHGLRVGGLAVRLGAYLLSRRMPCRCGGTCRRLPQATTKKQAHRLHMCVRLHASAENAVVIAEGELRHDGAFHARALGFPPAEARSDLPMASQVGITQGLWLPAYASAACKCAACPEPAH